VLPGQRQSLARISGPDAEGQLLTITLTTPTTDGAAGEEPEASAVVIWGSGGTNAEAEVDFARGLVLSVAASAVEVIGRNDARPDAPGARSLTLGAFVAQGGRPAGEGQRPRRTLRTADLVVGADPAVLEVPRFASRVEVFASPARGAFLADVQTRGGASLYELDAPGSYPLASSARRLVVSNPGGPPVRIVAVFAIAL
jgi:hypothetical protein